MQPSVEGTPGSFRLAIKTLIQNKQYWQEKSAVDWIY
jgi:hypothetical protein